MRHATALIFLLCVTSAVHAQPVRITFEPAPTSPPIVDDRPALTDWVANVHGASLIEGRLELSITANSLFLGSVLTDELVLTGVDQKVRILLPAFNWPLGADEIIVELKLITKHGVMNLPPQRLRTSMPMARKFPLLIGETKQRPRASSGRDKLADRLRFESLLPDDIKQHAITVMSPLTADDFPQDPLVFCHYEAVVVANDVFAALRTSQLDALAKWVRAGGSLYLEPAGILEPGHLEFLNRLAANDSRGLVFTLDDKGRLPSGTFTSDDGFLHLSPGLGRAVLGLPGDHSAVPESQWRNVAATLWKFRSELHQQPPSNISQVFLQSRAEYGTILSGPPLADVASQMVDWLRPQGVRMVPLWVIASLLGILVVLIGPVDYVVLGWLKRRRWTWITFPATVIVMTGLTMAITNAYLSSAETRRSFVIHDVADDGEIVRSNRFELVFASASRKLTTDVQGALFTPLLTGGQRDPRSYRRANPYDYGQNISESEPAVVQGRVPSRYRVFQDIHQWTPQLNRRFSIGPAADASKIDWDELTVPSVRDAAALSQTYWGELVTQIRPQLGPEAISGIATSNRLIYKSQDNLNLNADPRRHYSHPNFVDNYFYPSVPLDIDFLRLTSAPPLGFAALTTHTSPHGGRSLDDLPLTFTGATDRWWLVITVPQGDDIVVYRRSYPYSR